jgi:hypothetical protein
MGDLDYLGLPVHQTMISVVAFLDRKPSRIRALCVAGPSFGFDF